MRLYDIAADFRRLSDLLEDESTPEEMRQTIIDTLESLDGDFEDKAEGIAALIAENNATIGAIEDEIDRLRAKAGRLERQNDSLKRYLKAEMDFTGKRKLNAGIWKITIAKNGGKAPIVWKTEPDELDLGSLPEKYVKRTESINTAAVRETLEAGGFLSFAELGERGESLRIK